MMTARAHEHMRYCLSSTDYRRQTLLAGKCATDQSLATMSAECWPPVSEIATARRCALYASVMVWSCQHQQSMMQWVSERSCHPWRVSVWLAHWAIHPFPSSSSLPPSWLRPAPWTHIGLLVNSAERLGQARRSAVADHPRRRRRRRRRLSWLLSVATGQTRYSLASRRLLQPNAAALCSIALTGGRATLDWLEGTSSHLNKQSIHTCSQLHISTRSIVLDCMSNQLHRIRWPGQRHSVCMLTVWTTKRKCCIHHYDCNSPNDEAHAKHHPTSKQTSACKHWHSMCHFSSMH